MQSISGKLANSGAYLRRANSRPILDFLVGTYYPLHRFHGAATLPRFVQPADLKGSLFLEDNDRLFALHDATSSDLCWTATAFWGIPWLEAALGCEVEADHVSGSTRSHPPGGADWPAVPDFSLDNPWVACCLDLLRMTAMHAGGRYPLGTTLVRGVSDCLSALLGPTRMVLAMCDEPARVREMADHITDFLIAFLAAQLDVIPRFGGGYGSFLYNLWAPGRCVWVQEDAAALLSPALYKKIILPCNQRIASAFDFVFMHLHPAHFVPHRLLLDTDLAVIELHMDRAGPRAQELLPICREILSGKPLYVWGDVTDDDLRVLLHKLDPAGLCVGVVVDDLKRAQEVRELYRSFLDNG